MTLVEDPVDQFGQNPAGRRPVHVDPADDGDLGTDVGKVNMARSGGRCRNRSEHTGSQLAVGKAAARERRKAYVRGHQLAERLVKLPSWKAEIRPMFSWRPGVEIRGETGRGHAEGR
jgi:hypothetical protein